MKRHLRLYLFSCLILITIIILAKIHFDIDSHMYRINQILPPQELAKLSVEQYILNNRIVVPPEVRGVKNHKSGMFVTIVNKKVLRGCLGVTSPYIENTGGELVRLAILSATSDKRFSPVTKEELKNLNYSVDIMEPASKIKSVSELNPEIYGLIIISGSKSGVILPDIDGIKTPAEQIKAAKFNGGITDKEKIEIFKFKSKRYN